MIDDEFRPFQGLKELRQDLKTGPAAPARAEPEPDPPALETLPPKTPSQDEAELFLAAMGRTAPPPSVPGEPGLGHAPFAPLAKGKKRRAKVPDLGPVSPSGPRPGPEPDPMPGPTPDPIPDPELAAFARAMQGVAPLDGQAGRDLPKVPETPAPGPIPDPDLVARQAMEELIQGDVVFDCSLTDEFVAGQVRGLDPRIFNRLKAGSLAVEAHLDLHGMTEDAAQDEVPAFVRRHYLQGKRCLLLVTGRGLNSPDGMGILRGSVQGWLTREPLRRVVLAFVTAQPRHGGAGALYVLLRRFRKSAGKVRWDRRPQDMDLP